MSKRSRRNRGVVERVNANDPDAVGQYMAEGINMGVFPRPRCAVCDSEDVIGIGLWTLDREQASVMWGEKAEGRPNYLSFGVCRECATDPDAKVKFDAALLETIEKHRGVGIQSLRDYRAEMAMRN